MRTALREKLGAISTSTWLGLIMLLGLVLRLCCITTEGFWFDELIIWRQSQLTPSELIHEMIYEDVHPPLYQLLVYGWTRLFGADELWLRLPSTIFGVAAIYFAFRLGRRLIDEKIALLAALFVATSNFAVYYSQEARSYSLLLMLSLSTVWLWFEAREEGRLSVWLAYGLSGLLLAYTHAFGILLLVYLVLVWLGLRWRGAQREWSFKRWLMVHVAMGLLYLPWLPAAAAQASRIQHGFWIPRPEPLFFTHYFSSFVGHFVLAWVLVLLALVAVVLRRVQLAGAKPWVFGFALGWFVFLLGVPFVVSQISQPMMHDKSAISVLGAIALGFGLVIMALPRIVRPALVILWIVASIGAITWRTYLPQNREAWREMPRYVTEHWSEGDLAVFYHPNFDYIYCYEYYWPDELEAIPLICEGEACDEPVAAIEERAQAKGSERIFLLKVRASDDFPGPLETNWQRVERIEFNNGVLEILEPK